MQYAEHANTTDPKHAPSPLPEVAAWYIDAQGREIPITENMILRACQELDEQARAA